MGRKIDLKEARRLCYDDPIVEEPMCTNDPAEELDINVAYDLDTALAFRNSVNDFVEETSLPICEYLNDESIYTFLKTIIN
jgi:hypothetical protein